MNKKAESVKFVVIMSAALILIGLAFVTFGKSATISSKTTYTENECYFVYNEKLSTAETSQCCAQIKKSDGCKPYKDDLFICSGENDVVVNKNTIESC